MERKGRGSLAQAGAQRLCWGERAGFQVPLDAKLCPNRANVFGTKRVRASMFRAGQCWLSNASLRPLVLGTGPKPQRALPKIPSRVLLVDQLLLPHGTGPIFLGCIVCLAVLFQ